MGLFCAFDLPSAEVRAAFINQCFARGMMLWICGERSVRFRPPLNLTAAQVGEADGIIRGILDDLRAG